MFRCELLFALLLVLAGGCNSGPSAQNLDQLSGVATARYDTTGLDALEELTAKAAWSGDSAYCDSVLTHHADTSLARSRPALMVSLFFNTVMAHKTYQHRTLDRLATMAEVMDDDTLRYLHQYLHGRHLQIIGDPQGALRIFSALLPTYTSIGDSGGVANCAKRVGFIHAMDLDQPAEAIPYLRRAFQVEWVVEDRCDIALFLGRCFTRLGLPDSVDRYAAFLDEVIRKGSCAANPGPRPVGYRDQLRFNALALRAEKGSVPYDSLRALFEPTIAAYPPMNGVMPTTDYLDPHTHWELHLRYAKSLIAAGREVEARAVLTYADSSLSVCSGCEELEIDLHRTWARLYRALGDVRAAMERQDRLIAAMEHSGLEQRRRQMERIEATAAFEREQAAFAASRAAERAEAQAALQRVRTQRAMVIIVSLLVLTIAVLLLNRYRLKRRLQVEQLRARLSRDLHDDIGSTLSSINILSNLARKRAMHVADADVTASLDKISDRSQRLMREMSDIVWSVDPRKDTLEELLVRMRDFASTVLEAKGLAYTVDLPSDVPVIPLHAEVKNHLYLIFKEAINNAVKHAEASKVDVLIELNGMALRMEVTDNGRGFAARETIHAPGGNGMRNLRSRAKEVKANLQVSSGPGNGTSIVLCLPLAPGHA